MNMMKVRFIVFRDVTLFNNTVMENIRIGRKGAAGTEVVQAAKAAIAMILIGYLHITFTI